MEAGEHAVMPATVNVTLVRFGEPQPGEWCHRCMLPSVFVIRYAVVCATQVLGWGMVRVCDECGHSTSERTGEP